MPTTTSSSGGHDHSSGTGDCPGCRNSKDQVLVRAPKKCVVQFRPHCDWSGEYGFDWVREGEKEDAFSKIKGDCDYRHIVGKYTGKDKKGEVIYGSDPKAVFTHQKPEYDSLLTFYERFRFKWKNTHDKHEFVYKTPWLSLFPQDQCHSGNHHEAGKQFQAKLTLHLDVRKKEPQVLRFICTPNPECIKIEPAEIRPVKVGISTTELTITCLKEFAEEQSISVIPYPKPVSQKVMDPLSGMLSIMPNDKSHRYTANVLFVRVKTQLNRNNKREKPGTFDRDMKALQKVMFQTLTTVKYEVLGDYLDLTKPIAPYFHDAYTAPVGPKTKKLGISTTSTKGDGVGIHDYLDKQLATIYTKDYSSYYKIYLFSELGGYWEGKDYTALDGMAADIVADSVVVFLDHLISVVPHELMHAMGFYHSFDNDGTVTYKCEKTDNLMDYSDIAAKPIPLISTWKWQWDQLHAQVDSSDGKITKEK
jgi:hypothetical protein